jgi:hypothetical protein
MFAGTVATGALFAETASRKVIVVMPETPVVGAFAYSRR